MKKLIYLLPMLFVLAMAAYAGDQDFTLVNETGVTIDEFYCSAVSTNDWEEDILGQDTLPDGESVDISFAHSEEECNWDFKIKDEDGNEIFWRNVDLCEISTVTIHYEDGKAWATYEAAE
jgi:hypothetical protein